MKRYFDILATLTVILFGLFIILPETNSVLHFIPEEKGNENRAKTKRPEADITRLDRFVKDYDRYYTDNFSLRENLIVFLNRLEFFIFGVSSVPDQMVVGNDGWFYEMKSAPNYKAANLFSKNELERLKLEIIKRTLWAAKKGIRYYLVIVPNKMNIYPEHLPSKIIKLSAITRYDQVAALKEEPGLNIIDLKENILKHKNDGYDLYQHTDDHWNDLGAYYGYEAIMKRLNKDFIDLEAIPLRDFNIEFKKRLGNMAGMISMAEYYPEKFVSLKPKNKMYGHDGIRRGYPVPPGIADWDAEIVKANDNGKKLKCLIIRDSFTLAMIKFFQENFKECIFIHDAWKYKMHEHIISKENPNIILNIILETELKKLIEFPFQPNIYQKADKQVCLLASNGKYLCTENYMVFANRQTASTWETYSLMRDKNNKYSIRTYDNLFLSVEVEKNKQITAAMEEPGGWETFTLIKLDSNCIAFKAANGKYVGLDEKSSRLFARSDSIGRNERFHVIVK